MNPSTPITDEQLREDMIAYLDGELDSEASLRIEQRLAADHAFAVELRELQRAYEMLDDLPQPQVNETFAATTVEMIAVEARHEIDRQKADAPRRRRLVQFSLALSLLVAIFGGYLLTGVLLPDPNAALLRDMRVIERLDEYQQVESIEFLRGLQASGLFDQDDTASLTPKESSDAS